MAPAEVALDAILRVYSRLEDQDMPTVPDLAMVVGLRCSDILASEESRVPQNQMN